MNAPLPLDEDTAARLRRRAERHGRSVEAEAQDILRAALADEVAPPEEGLGTRIQRLFAEVGLTEEEHRQFEAHIAELRQRPWRTVDFGE